MAAKPRKIIGLTRADWEFLAQDEGDVTVSFGERGGLLFRVDGSWGRTPREALRKSFIAGTKKKLFGS